MQKKIVTITGILLLTACAPQVGSKKWCENLSAKSKGDWTINEAKDYAVHCIFPKRDDKALDRHSPEADK